MEIFWLFVGILLLTLYFNSRLKTTEQRLRELEKKIQAGALPGVSRETTDSVSVGKILEEREVAWKEIPAPIIPAPAPLPIYASQEMAIPANLPQESSEERSARWLGRIGAFAVLVGVAFFLKYAFDNDWIGPTGRVALGIIAGLATIAVGQKLRATYLNYSDILMASGIGILYLSIYASYGFYHLVEPSVAFVLMGLVTAFGMVLAIAGGTIGLGILSTLGGFITPVLLSTGENHLVTLSVYMIILDLGVFGVAWFKKWASLNYLSFAGTVVLFEGWLGSFYSKDQLLVTFFFVTVFFLIFLATSVVYHIFRNKSATISDLIRLNLNAGGYFLVSYWLLDPENRALLGFFSLCLSVLYLAVAYLSYSQNQADRTLNLFLPGISVVFLTIAIPLQLSGHAIPLAWLIEAFVLVGIGLYLKERVVQVFGWLVLLAGGIRVGMDVSEIHNSLTSVAPFWNMGFFLMCISVIVLYAIAWLYARFRENEPEWANSMLLAVSLASFATALTLNVELSLRMRYWESLPWLVEGMILLIIGLKLSSRIVESLGWVFAGWALITMFSDVGSIHAGIAEYAGSVSGITVYEPVPFMNLGFFMMLCSVVAVYAFAALYRKYKAMVPEWEKLATALIIIANLLTVTSVTWEISFKYDQDAKAITQSEAQAAQKTNDYYGGINSGDRYYQPSNTADTYVRIQAIESSKNTAITVFWAIYAILLIAIGFIRRLRVIRLFGLIFFFVTAARVFLYVWQLGQLERIISSIVFGVIALGAAFLYVKYKDRI